MKAVLSKSAEKYLQRLNEPTLSRVHKALADLEKDPPQGDIKKMEGRGINRYRLRMGKYRALFKIEDNRIFITSIDSRGQAYKE